MGGVHFFEAGHKFTNFFGLHQGGHLFVVGTYLRWALIRGGYLFEVGTYSHWVHI